MPYRLVALTFLLFLMTGCEREPITIAPSQVKIVEERAGEGPAAKPGDIVVINYTVHLPDGSVVLEEDQYNFRLGTGAVIEGIDDAVEGMQRGGWRLVRCPPNKHWGSRGYADEIPPRAILEIELTLVRIH